MLCVLCAFEICISSIFMSEFKFATCLLFVLTAVELCLVFPTVIYSEGLKLFRCIAKKSITSVFHIGVW